MKAYYAHCMALYGTPQEGRDIALLKSLGFKVVNPSDEKIEAEVKTLPKKQRMDFFRKYAKDCDLCVFRALPDGSIPGGVNLEISWFQDFEKPVIELPSGLKRRGLTYEQTSEYLTESGSR